MSGLLALLDDVAALAKLTAAQIDDVAAQAAKASAKAAGVVIDDSAVTPKYVVGLPAAREIPIVAKIARGSLFNKLVILLPAALILNTLAPWLLTPLLMIGGAYLCFEGAEKVWHALHTQQEHATTLQSLDAAHLEQQRIAGAIKTDFILSAEIMTIALAAIDPGTGLWQMALVLALVAVGITAGVYGAVALLVKADDFGLKLSQVGRSGITRALGHGIVKWMPAVMNTISTIGTAAMLWVGGSIIVHGLEQFGFAWVSHTIHVIAEAAQSVHGIGDILGWMTKATLDGIVGLVIGLALIPVVHAVINPIIFSIAGKKAASDAGH
jgi:predicted DNA repair protein MutK